MKKGWLRDRKVAIVITIIIMILSTGFGAHRSLENRGEYAEWVFYHGSYGDGGGRVFRLVGRIRSVHSNIVPA